MTIASNLGFPRIGGRRELKLTLERHWAGELGEAGLVFNLFRRLLLDLFLRSPASSTITNATVAGGPDASTFDKAIALRQWDTDFDLIPMDLKCRDNARSRMSPSSPASGSSSRAGMGSWGGTWSIG